MDIGDDILDSRDIQDRIDELTEELDTLEAAVEDAEDDDERGEAEDDLTSFQHVEGEELNNLIELKDDVNSSEWKYGITFIKDTYFEEYAEQLASDIGAIDTSFGWPNNCIDWEKAAEELLYDYSSVTVDGYDYYYRS